MMRIPSWSRLENHSPVIVIGMHRSGTSLVSHLLDMFGVFMGADLDPNAESKHFRSLNKHSFRAVEGDWNTPQLVIKAMESPQFVSKQASYYQQHLLSGWGGMRYWGVKRWMALAVGGNMPHWGWKDPRTSLTLPAWLQVFPEAHVVHIIRNGIDVAISLHRRQLKQHTRVLGTHPDHRDPRGYDLRFCFQLWEIYQRHLLTYRNTVLKEQYIEITYETLLRDPENTLHMLLSQLRVPHDEAAIRQAAATINRGRLDNRDYAAPYHDVVSELVAHPLMKELGYSKI
jgi:LPS sulfotransferase NodH